MGEPKNNFTFLHGLHISSTLEETFHESCLKSPGTGHHVQNQSRRLKIRNTHGILLKRQPPACQRIPVATKDRSERTECQAYKTRDIEQSTRGQDNKKKAPQQTKTECVAQQRESPGGRHLAFFLDMITCAWCCRMCEETPTSRGKTPPGNFRHFATTFSVGHSYLMARTTCNCHHHRKGTISREKQQRS